MSRNNLFGFIGNVFVILAETRHDERRTPLKKFRTKKISHWSLCRGKANPVTLPDEEQRNFKSKSKSVGLPC